MGQSTWEKQVALASVPSMKMEGRVLAIGLMVGFLIVANGGADAAAVAEEAAMPLTTGSTEAHALGDSVGEEVKGPLNQEQIGQLVSESEEKKGKLLASIQKAHKEEKDARAARKKAMLDSDEAKIAENTDLIKVARVNVMTHKVALVKLENEIHELNVRMAAAEKSARQTRILAQKKMEKANEAMSKVTAANKQFELNTLKDKASATTNAAQASELEAKQYFRAAAAARAKNLRQTALSETTAVETNKVADKAVESAKAAGKQAEDASIMAEKHREEVKASEEQREVRLQQDLGHFSNVAKEVGKAKMQRGDSLSKAAAADLKDVKQAIADAKKDFQDFKKSSQKTVDYLNKNYKAKKTMSATAKLGRLVKEQTSKVAKAKQHMENIIINQNKEKKVLDREAKHAKRLKSDGEAMMKAPAAEKKEANEKSERAKVNQKEIQVKKKKAEKRMAEWKAKKVKERKAFENKIHAKGAQMEANLKKTEKELAKAEGELDVQTAKVKSAANSVLNGEGKKTPEAAKEEAAVTKKEVEASEKLKDAKKKVVAENREVTDKIAKEDAAQAKVKDTEEVIEAEKEAAEDLDDNTTEKDKVEKKIKDKKKQLIEETAELAK